jgi:hypothetical protein
MVPQTIISGYPEKLYIFTDTYESVTLGNRRTAMRNRKTISVPVYKAEDGEIMLLMV